MVSRIGKKRAPQQKRSSKTYRAVLDAAHLLFRQHPFSEVTSDRIAKAAGVAVGSVYAYFDNKEEILLLVYQERNDRLFEEVSKELGPEMGRERPLEEFLDFVVEFLAVRFREDRFLLQSIEQMVVQSEKFRDVRRDSDRRAMEIIRRIFEGFKDSYVQEDLEIYTYLLHRMWHDSLRLSILYGYNYDHKRIVPAIKRLMLQTMASSS